MKRILAAALLALSASAQAGIDGNGLLELLDSKVQADVYLGAGYVIGVRDSNDGVAHCVPPGTSSQMLNLVREKLAATDADLRRAPADIMVTVILAKTWPCQAAKPVSAPASIS